jgi:tocopherol O-methyltransferase
MLVERFGADVTGFTISEAQYRYAVAHESDRLKFVRRDWLDNRVPEESFDALVSIECASHIKDKYRWMSEMHRTLRPGGRVAFTAWLCHPHAAAWQRRHLLEPICREGRLAGLATLDEYRHIAEASGFLVVHGECISRAVSRTWSICARRLITGLITQPRYVKVLFDRSNANRIFALTLFRIMAAYRCGAMQYGLFGLRKPDVA